MGIEIEIDITEKQEKELKQKMVTIINNKEIIPSRYAYIKLKNKLNKLI